MAASITTQASTMYQLIPREIWASLESEGSALLKEVQATHTPDGRKVDVKPLLRIIDSILLRATTPVSIVDFPTGMHEDKGLFLDDKASLPDSDVKLRAHADIINKVSYELVCCNNYCVTAMATANKPILSPFGVKMACKCLSTGGDAQAKTMALLKILSNYSWDAKVVLIMASFVANYGDFFLFAPTSFAKISSFSQSIALLRQLRDITEYAKLTKTKFEAIVKLMNVIMGLTTCIIEFNDLPLDSEEPSVSTAMSYVPKAAYWTILNVVVCAAQIVALTGFQESSTELSWDLSNWASEGIKIRDILKFQLSICKEQVDEKRKLAYVQLINFVNERKESNLEFFRTFLSVNGRQYLLDRTNKKIGFEELRKKNVLLLISGLDLSKEEINTLEMWYQESQKKAGVQYQVVWLPIVDESISWDQEMHQKYEQLRILMPWYIVPEPSKIKPEVITYIKKQWNFEKKMILVPVDPQGNVQSLNALDMLRIKGFEAFPFTKEKEESLWENQSWTLELLFGGINQAILNKAKEGKIVCIFGGEDIQWIREFIGAAKNVEQNLAATGISLELFYVGKNNAVKQVEKVIKTIDADKLGLHKIDLTSILSFWSRLDSILYLKMKQGKNFKNDDIMREVTTLLSYDGSDKGWALFCKGSSEMTIAKGDVALKSIKQLNEWWTDAVAREKGFLQALSIYFQQSRTLQYYHRIVLTGNRWEIPGKVFSAEGCECTLEKCFIYSCCAE